VNHEKPETLIDHIGDFLCVPLAQSAEGPWKDRQSENSRAADTWVKTRPRYMQIGGIASAQA